MGVMVCADVIPADTELDQQRHISIDDPTSNSISKPPIRRLIEGHDVTCSCCTSNPIQYEFPAVSRSPSASPTLLPETTASLSNPSKDSKPIPSASSTNIRPISNPYEYANGNQSNHLQSSNQHQQANVIRSESNDDDEKQPDHEHEHHDQSALSLHSPSTPMTPTPPMTPSSEISVGYDHTRLPSRSLRSLSGAPNDTNDNDDRNKMEENLMKRIQVHTQMDNLSLPQTANTQNTKQNAIHHSQSPSISKRREEINKIKVTPDIITDYILSLNQVHLSQIWNAVDTLKQDTISMSEFRQLLTLVVDQYIESQLVDLNPKMKDSHIVTMSFGLLKMDHFRMRTASIGGFGMNGNDNDNDNDHGKNMDVPPRSMIFGCDEMMELEELMGDMVKHERSAKVVDQLYNRCPIEKEGNITKAFFLSNFQNLLRGTLESVL